MLATSSASLLRPATQLSRLLWRSLTSVRGAALLILVLAAAGLAGTLLPQMPAGVAGDARFETTWLDGQRGRFGSLTTLLYRLHLFNVFYAPWFLALFTWLTAAIVACTVNRLPKLAREALRPRQRVPDALFERKSAAHLSADSTPDTVESALRRRRFRVRRTSQGEATYLFADRFGWAVLGTLATHVGLVLFLVGAVISMATGFTGMVAMSEGASKPVFPLGSDENFVVGVERVVGAFDGKGRPLDYRSDLQLYENGVLVKSCTITVNAPCSLNGYRFHQAGFFDQAVELIVREVPTGNTLYHETVALSTSLAAPRITVKDVAGTPVYEGTPPQIVVLDEYTGAIISVADGPFWIGLEFDLEWSLTILDPSSEGGKSALVAPGESASVGDFTFAFEGVESVPSSWVASIPLPFSLDFTEDSGELLLALEDARVGTAPETGSLSTATESPALHIGGLGQFPIRLEEGEIRQVGTYEYEFVGQRAFTGITVRKDRGDTIIWIAGGIFILGVALTLWLPRGRAWFRFTAGGDGRMYSTGRTRVQFHGEDR